jgi:hypothetical protein
MAAETDPLEADQGPDADATETPGEPAEDTAPDAAEAAETDWEARYKDAAKTIGRQANELGVLRRTAGTPQDGAPADGSSGEGSYLEAQNQTLADELFGEDVVAAYGAAEDLLVNAQTPADWYSALEAYHQARLAGVQAPAAAAGNEPATGARTRQEALQPRVDPNRSDGGPDSDDAGLAEAGKKGDPKFWDKAASALGFGPAPR